MRNEIKIGLLAIVAIGLAFWGYKFIQGQNLLKRSTTLYAFYANAAGLTVGTPVTVSGVSVGSVSEILLVMDKQMVRVAIELDKDIQVPESTVAVITTTSIMGGKGVDLVFDRPCSGADCVEDGDIIQGRERGILASFLGEGASSVYMDSVKSAIGHSIDSLNQTLFGEDSNHPIAASSRDLRATMANLKAASAQLDYILQRSSGNLNSTMANLNSLTSSLNRQTGTIASIIQNADTVSQALVEADVAARLREVSRSIQALQGTLESADTALGNVSQIVDQIQNGNGTLGRLIYDEQLYERLNRVSYNADTLINDIQERPYRYVPFKSRNRVLRFDRKDEKLEEELQEELKD